MGNVVFKNGIGYSEASGARYVDMDYIALASAKDMQPARPAPLTKPYEPIGVVYPWSPWGKNNLLGAEMACDIKQTGVLNGIIEGKTRFAISQGLLPAIINYENSGKPVVEKILSGTEVNSFLESNNNFFTILALIKDYIGFNRSIGRIGLNRKGDMITQLRRADVTESRMARKDGQGNIRHVWYSADWSKVRGENDPNVFREPLLNPHNPYQELRDRIDNGDTNRWFSVMVSHPGWQEQYYPMPMWMAQILWVKIAQGVPEMKAVMFENNIRVKYIVIIYESFWTEAFGDDWEDYTDEEKEKKKKKVYEDIDEFLVGSKNAYKSVFTTGYRDSEGKTYANIEIKPIEDYTKQGELLPDSAAANSEIAFSMLWNNAMTGGNQASGLYESSQGGSNVRESILMQVIIHEVERQMMKSIMNVIKRFNGWDVKFPGLDFIIPATILTTLDTGAGSKQVLTGDAKPKEDGANKNN
jgi:hypothetical protein